MAIEYDHDFTGTGGTNGSAATPAVGAAMVVSLGGSPQATLDGFGNLQGSSADTWYALHSGVGEGTWKIFYQPGTFFNSVIEFAFNCANAAAFWDGDGCGLLLRANDFSGVIALVDRGAGYTVDGTLATTPGTVVDAPTSAWVRLDTDRCRVWKGANVDPLSPDLDFTGLPRTSGVSGLKIGGVGAFVSRITYDTVPSSPGGPPPLQNPVEVFDTDLTAVEVGGIALASEEIGAAGPTIYVIESATALQLTGTTPVTRSAAIVSATQIQLTGATAAAATPRITSATALSLANAQPVITGPAISLATALSLAGVTDVGQLARILSATQLQLTGEIPVVYIGGTPVYDIVSATQLVLTGAMPIRFDAAAALATTVALQGGTGVTTAPSIAAATALSFAQAAVVGLNPDVRLATALGLAGASPMLLAPAIAGGTALTLTGVATLQRLLPFGSATQLVLANAIPVLLDTGTPVYVITSVTQLQLTGGIGMVLAPRLASASSLALANAQPVVGGPAVSLATALSLAGSILARTDRAIAVGSALALEGQTVLRSSAYVIRSATELRLSGQILIGIVTPTGIAWVTYRTLVAPAVASLIARAPAVRSASRTAPAVRLQRAVLPSLDEVP